MEPGGNRIRIRIRIRSHRIEIQRQALKQKNQERLPVVKVIVGRRGRVVSERRSLDKGERRIRLSDCPLCLPRVFISYGERSRRDASEKFKKEKNPVSTNINTRNFFSRLSGNSSNCWHHMSHFEDKMHRIRFLLSIRLSVRWNFTLNECKNTAESKLFQQTINPSNVHVKLSTVPVKSIAKAFGQTSPAVTSV